MVKFLLTCLVLVAIVAACDITETEFTPETRREYVILEWPKDQTAEEIAAACGKDLVGDFKAKGCIKTTMIAGDTYARIYAKEVTAYDSVEADTLKHELFHMIYGDYHPVTTSRTTSNGR